MSNISMLTIKELITKLWGDKRTRLIIITIGIVLVILFIWWVVSIYTQKKASSTVYLIDTPLSFSTNHSVDIASTIYQGNKFPSSLNVYPIANTDQVPNIDRFLLSTGKSNMNKTNVQDVYYTWLKNEDTVDYAPNTFQLNFKFSSPLSITSGLPLITKDNANQYIVSLLKNYFGKDYSYMNINFITQGNRIRIEFNRSIDGYPLFLSGLDSFSEYIVIDSSGNLYQGTLNLIDLNVSGKESINIVNVNNLSTVMQSDLYPKEVFQGAYPNTFPAPTGSQVSEADYLTQSQAIPIATSSTAKTVTLGYFFFNNTYTRLVPVYRIESEGTVIYQNKSYKVPLVVVANALDPKRVYLPQ